jgi:ABC transporter
MKIATALSIRSITLPSVNIIQIQNGTFYRQHPGAAASSALQHSDPPLRLFPNLDFSLPALPLRSDTSNCTEQQHWAVIGASGSTTFLEILRGSHVCIPPNARTYPYLSSDDIEAKDHRLRSPAKAIRYVGFTPGNGQTLGRGIKGSYLSARYESRREETDWSVLQYLRGETELNPSEILHPKNLTSTALLSQVIKDLRLERLAFLPVSNLSNGQTRRARIAKALLDRPEVLLLDEPFSRYADIQINSQLMSPKWDSILLHSVPFLPSFVSWHTRLLRVSSCHYVHKIRSLIGSLTSLFSDTTTHLLWRDPRRRFFSPSIDGLTPT